MSTEARSVAPDRRRRAPAWSRWLATLAFALFAVAALIVVTSVGFTGVVLVALGLLSGGALLAGGYWFLARRGPARWAGAVLAITAVAVFVLGFARADVLLVALVAVALVALGGTAARSALKHSPEPWMPTYEAPAPLHPFFVMNPRSGGGKVERLHLREKAEALGAEVALLDGPTHVDVAALVRDAVGRGADLLGVAGGDGTQALVAGIAADHDLPFVVICAGTRNHFALDLGLDRQDPAGGLDALVDGVEVRVDLGFISDRPFVNNASFGAYAQIVQSPDYRDNKGSTALSMLPDLLNRQDETLTVQVGGAQFPHLQAALVSNNPYGSGRLHDLGRRFRIDRGVLGVMTGTIDSASSAVSLLRRAERRPVRALTGPDVVVAASTPQIPVGVDGEALILPSPVHCAVRARALRVRLPRHRPGVPPPPVHISWRKLWRLATFRPLDVPENS